MSRALSDDEIATIRARHFGWEDATPSLLAAVFGTSIQHIAAILRDTTPGLPQRCCGRCRNWTRKNPDDLTAPEGRCGLSVNPGHWPTGYWPSTLQRDGCLKFRRAPIRESGPRPTGVPGAMPPSPKAPGSVGRGFSLPQVNDDPA